MKESTKRAKLSILNTYHKCLLHDPLGYGEPDKYFLYYNILTNATKQGLSCYVWKFNNKYELFIDNKKQER